jgi:hypothetical protein
MKEKSHRATRRCYRSGVDVLRGTHERRLDGYRLYIASDVPMVEREMVRRGVTPRIAMEIDSNEAIKRAVEADSASASCPPPSSIARCGTARFG